MSDILDDMAQSARESLQKGITDEALAHVKKKLRDAADECFTVVEDQLKEDLAPSLADYVKRMAADAINSLLQGNDGQMRRYLGCERGGWNGRSDGSSGWGREREIWEWHQVIHGKLFETGSVALRRALVDAHRDLITSERIKDLEDQVAALVAQVNREKKARETAEERVRDYIR